MTFHIIDKKTGKEPDLRKIALTEEWAQGLAYCNMEGFAIEGDGNLILLDSCGGFRYCPYDRFKIIIEDSANGIF